MDRRDFVIMGASALSLGACAGARYVTPTVAEDGLVVPRAALDADGELFVQAPGMQRPIYVRRAETGQPVALLALCTHNGCQPERVGDRLACPCHGSEFGFDGRVLQGPAERPLTSYEVVEREGDLVIRVDRGAVR